MIYRPVLSDTMPKISVLAPRMMELEGFTTCDLATFVMTAVSENSRR